MLDATGTVMNCLVLDYMINANLLRFNIDYMINANLLRFYSLEYRIIQKEIYFFTNQKFFFRKFARPKRELYHFLIFVIKNTQIQNLGWG